MIVKKVLITGASGYIGSAAIQKFRNLGWEVTASSREIHRNNDDGVRLVRIADPTNWRLWADSVSGINTVVHCAGLAHVAKEFSKNAMFQFDIANVQSTLALARASYYAGVERLIFISSIGVNGNATYGEPFDELSLPNPLTDYAKSKYNAETELTKFSHDNKFDIVIVRPPLVYGPNAPGNFGRLVRLLSFGVPLPLGGINNVRSFIGLDNFVDFLFCLASNARASNQLFLVSDAEALSTTAFLIKIQNYLKVSSKLYNIPLNYLIPIGKVFGFSQPLFQLSSSLEINSAYARNTLEWNPPLSVDEGLERAIRYWKFD
jgi:nucleoside-diphosphate-sugar epimerase